jgi:transcriptional regulator with XRE-family HTH domain
MAAYLRDPATPLAARIRVARQALNLTQAQFGLHLGRRLRRGYFPDNVTISRWETQKQAPGKIWLPVLEKVIAGVADAYQDRKTEG